MQPVELGKSETLLADGQDAAIIAAGAGVQIALDAAAMLRARGIGVTVINARFVKPLDNEAIVAAARACKQVVTVEDNVVAGGFGSGVLELLSEAGVQTPVRLVGLPDEFVEHGPVPVLRNQMGLTAAHVAAIVSGESPEVFDPARHDTPETHVATVA